MCGLQRDTQIKELMHHTTINESTHSFAVTEGSLFNSVRFHETDLTSSSVNVLQSDPIQHYHITIT